MTRTVAVTGAAGALGRTTAQVLGQAGWNVVGIDLAEGPFEGVALGLGGVDLTDEGAMKIAAERIESQFGKLEGLVNIAGGFQWETIVEGDIATWDRLYAMNIKTTLVTSRALEPLLRASGGAIVNIGAAASIKAGLALVTEDRKATGLVMSSSVRFNASLPALPGLQRAGVVDGAAERVLVGGLLQRLRVKLASPAMPVSGLSGGNQQKVVLARCMATNPVCLLCDEPTRGIDEGAKREVYAFLASLAAQGHAVVVVSSEAPELLELSDRIAIFRKGRLDRVVAGHGITQEALMHLAS